MNSSSKKFIALIAITVLICSCFFILVTTQYSQVKKSANLEKGDNKKRISTDGPCRFLAPEGVEKSEAEFVAYKRRMARETYGYPESTFLAEAIKIFNEEAACNYVGKTQPLLVEEEVIAAALEAAASINAKSSSGNSFLAEKNALEKISIEKLMPKGSLLASESGYRQLDKQDNRRYIHIRCWKIYVYLGLDKNPREANELRPEQVYLIRKYYVGAEFEYLK